MPFIKGHIGYNKGKHLVGEHRKCLRCNKECWFNRARILNGGGRYCSQNCSNKSTQKKGKENQNWKGDKVGYFGIHDWLQLNFGKANKCEQCGSIKKIQWAKLKGKEYERKRENFWQLCSKCHIIYDDTIIKGGWNKGIKWSKAVRKRISQGTKIGMAKLKQNG